ncbi:MAG: enterotoxin, partial [Clostridiales bacterium]|nr:enterotoxin [Clostridiales bacterium]
MKNVFKISILALLVSNGAFAANYKLNNDNIAISFDDAQSAAVIKDTHTQRQLSPQSLFFLTLPDET